MHLTCNEDQVGLTPTGGSNGMVPEWLKGKRCKRFDVMSTEVRILPIPRHINIRAIISVS